MSGKEVPGNPNPYGLVSLSTATSCMVVAGSMYWLYRTVNAYGWDGTIRYLWQGDPYTEDIRERLNILDEATMLMDLLQREVLTIESGLEQARNTTGETPTRSSAGLLALWQDLVPFPDLPKKLSMVSYDIDKAASLVDQISAVNVANIRCRKKDLSERAVGLMSRVDALIQQHTTATLED